MVKKWKFRVISVSVAVAALSFGGGMLRCDARSLTAGAISQQEPDNTGVNKQNNTTADQQKETAEDRELAQKIRQSIVSDKSLSTYGHNVEVIVRNGMVTLKGPVQSEEEKKSIESKAADVAGADKVTNKLTVKS
jgi:osmotically-inducible protein OsmY